MAYRFPTTRVSFYEGVPLDNTYTHTLYFATQEEQTAYFDSFPEGVTKQSYSNLSFQRVSDGVIRVQANASDMWAFNYMSFANDGFGVFERYKNKTWYAFVTGIKYINENTTEVTYEIDLMQSWMFYYDLGIQYVVREMSATDGIGDNIVLESLPTGNDTVQNDYKTAFSVIEESVKMRVVFALGGGTDYTEKGITTLPTAISGLISNIYQGCDFFAFSALATDTIKAFINEVTVNNLIDNVVAVFMCPGFIMDNYATNSTDNDVDAPGVGSTIDGYSPKNKKLLTYPYNYLIAGVQGNGTQTYYRYEYFDNSSAPTFHRVAQLSTTPSITVYPTAYKENRNTNGLLLGGDMEHAVTANSFPICSFNVDSFKAWFAQNAYNIGWDIASTGLSATTGSLAGNLPWVSDTMSEHMAMHGTSGLINDAKQYMQAAVMPNRIEGNTENSNWAWTVLGSTIYFCRRSINAEYARMIDDYFTRFGYACGRLKVPNINVRPHWNYVKLNGCSLTGHLPADDLRRLEQIYDNGITFWKSGAEVGNYSLDNSPA